MRILHLSDLHYGKKYEEKIQRMMPSFLDCLQQTNQECEIDLVVFTGDLVWSGINLDKFYEINDQFITPVVNTISLDSDRFILCPGNHDMSNQNELQAISDYIQKIVKNDELDSFIKASDQQFDLSFEKSKSYYEFIKDYYQKDDIQKLYQCFSRNIKGKAIGLVSLHSPWRSFIGNHSGHLLIPNIVVFDALKSLPKHDLYISLMHHPISDLKFFNRTEVEDIIYEKFHINFSGHYHKKRQSVVFTHDIGMLSVSAAASMSGNDGSSIGFSIIDIDVDTFEILLTNYSYIVEDNVFVETSKIPHNLPMNEKKSEQVNILKRLKDLHDIVVQEANSLLINFADDREDVEDFIHNFNNPILKEKSYFESIETQKKITAIESDQLLNSNFIVYAKDKYGKTSLLRKLQLESIESFQDNKLIPIYIDFRNQRQIESFSLENEILKIFHITRRKAGQFIDENRFQFLIDNFIPSNQHHSRLINILMGETDDCVFTLTSEETQESYITEISISGAEFSKLFIHPLNRKDIRHHTSKMLSEYNSDLKQEIIQKIVLVFNQMNIPFNYWYLSLFLWIYKKEKNISINDNVELLILYIDKLLEREQIAKYNKNIDYELFKKLLGELSYELIVNHYDTDYSLSYEELVSFISKFKEENIRFVTGIKEIIDYLLEKGIMKQTVSLNSYTFRLKGVMEYFTAVYMLDDEKFVDTILNDDMYFLGFANEIEIYAGLDRRNNRLLENLYNKTKYVFMQLTEKYKENPDQILEEKIKNSDQIAKSIALINVHEQFPIHCEEQDKMLDDIDPIQNCDDEVKAKDSVECKDGYSTMQLERHAFILSRAFRGLTLINDTDLINDSFELIVNSYINIGFELLYEFDLIKEKTEKDIKKKIIEILTSFIPLLTQMNLSGALVHKNLTRFVIQQIEKIEENTEENQYKLMLLYFMLLDIDLNRNVEFIDKLSQNIKMLSLKNVSVVKLFYYLIIKSNGDKKLEAVLKNKIVDLQTTLHPDADKTKLIQNVDKKLLLRKEL